MSQVQPRQGFPHQNQCTNVLSKFLFCIQRDRKTYMDLANWNTHPSQDEGEKRTHIAKPRGKVCHWGFIRALGGRAMGLARASAWWVGQQDPAHL